MMGRKGARQTMNNRLVITHEIAFEVGEYRLEIKEGADWWLIRDGGEGMTVSAENVRSMFKWFFDENF